MLSNREFSVENEYTYNRSSPVRWIVSHVARYPLLPVVFVLTAIAMAATQSLAAVLLGRAFDTAVGGAGRQALLIAATSVSLAYLGYAFSDIVNTVSARMLAQRFERDVRDEVYLNLLGKSQTFHGRQRVGELMARVTNDVQQSRDLISPGIGLVIESVLTLLLPLVAIAVLNVQLLAVPLVFLVAVAFALLRYNRQLRPVAGALRERFGVMNAEMTEAVAGIELVKGYAQEDQEERKFGSAARSYRDAFMREGRVQARALPLLVYGIAVGLAFGHALLLFLRGQITVGDVIAYMALLSNLRMPLNFLLHMFSVMQQSMASIRRVLVLLSTETELDENAAGISKIIDGDLVFEHVGFAYGGEALPGGAEEVERAAPGGPVLHDISFHARPGETIAIVGQTGAGKTTLTRLVNRIFDATSGQVRVDGVDVRDWSLHRLRSQIGTIEQDIVLFSRTIAENIAFGASGEVSREQIEHAARLAQAHDFISAFPEGYETVVGERGVTLSGGQRQRIAIARAFLTNPRILILDDSTSAIDSNTEDQIQRAMRRILQGRTTLLITHRLAQISRADRILLLRNGELLAQGSHAELLTSSEDYRTIFGLEAASPLDTRAFGIDSNPAGASPAATS